MNKTDKETLVDTQQMQTDVTAELKAESCPDNICPGASHFDKININHK